MPAFENLGPILTGTRIHPASGESFRSGIFVVTGSRQRQDGHCIVEFSREPHGRSTKPALVLALSDPLPAGTSWKIARRADGTFSLLPRTGPGENPPRALGMRSGAESASSPPGLPTAAPGAEANRFVFSGLPAFLGDPRVFSPLLVSILKAFSLPLEADSYIPYLAALGQKQGRKEKQIDSHVGTSNKDRTPIPNANERKPERSPVTDAVFGAPPDFDSVLFAVLARNLGFPSDDRRLIGLLSSLFGLNSPEPEAGAGVFEEEALVELWNRLSRKLSLEKPAVTLKTIRVGERRIGAVRVFSGSIGSEKKVRNISVVFFPEFDTGTSADTDLLLEQAVPKRVFSWNEPDRGTMRVSGPAEEQSQDQSQDDGVSGLSPENDLVERLAAYRFDRIAHTGEETVEIVCNRGNTEPGTVDCYG